MKYALTAILTIVTALAYGQNDTITLKNKDVIVGEIKSVAEGILTIETDYSDDDFTIDFDEVTKISVERESLIVLTGGNRKIGYVRSDSLNSVTITLDDGTVEQHSIRDVTVLQEVKKKFINRITAFIDFGVVFAKANNATKFTLGAGLDYTGFKWIITSKVDFLNSTQDNAERIKRTDADAEFIRLLPKNWYLQGGISFLQNTEQALDGRFSFNAAFGRLVVNNNKMYLGLSAGINYNVESFVDSSLDKSSTEFLFNANLNMFDFEDLDLSSGVKIFPSISEANRWRIDFDLNVKYDLPLDFYIKLGFTLNYDNQPAIAGTDVDYIVNTGIGWDFN